MTEHEQDGRRVYPGESGHCTLAEGDYGKEADDSWVLRPPGSQLGSLEGHEIIEHEDGTITIWPSILLDGEGALDWHGWLERGVWRW